MATDERGTKRDRRLAHEKRNMFFYILTLLWYTFGLDAVTVASTTLATCIIFSVIIIIGAVVSPLIATGVFLMCLKIFGTTKILIVTFHISTFGMFWNGSQKVVDVFLDTFEKMIQEIGDWMSPEAKDSLLRLLYRVRHTRVSRLKRAKIVVTLWLYFAWLFVLRFGYTIKKALTVALTGCVLFIFTLLHYDTVERFLRTRIRVLLKSNISFRIWLQAVKNGMTASAETYKGLRRNATLFVVTVILAFTNMLLVGGLFTSKYIKAKPRYKYSKIMRETNVAFAHFIDAQRVPNFIRNVFRFDPDKATQEEINDVLEESLRRLDNMGYPAQETSVQEPIYNLDGGKWDMSWLKAGTNWRIHSPQIKTYAQTEFKNLCENLVEYKYSLTFANLDNQVASISRYFAEPETDFPTDAEVFNAVWEIVKDIYKDSRIMPIYAIVKGWNKKYNMGVFASSSKRNRHGGFKKMKRREWLKQFTNMAEVVEAFEKMFAHSLTIPAFSQFFTKLENLPPTKWMKDKVRTPIAGALPLYIYQMVISGDPNKRFLYETTPIKLGMPLKGSVMSAMWDRHARFKRHFAGDCTAFDSTISGGLIDMIKAVRKKGFEKHKECSTIEWMIDTLYDKIEHTLMVSANSGNVYKKGSGLMTGHASTSSDNSLAMVALYLAAWVKLTGRSASEFKACNELSVYGDDHVLSISEFAPAAWTWPNIVAVMKTWNVEMREEIDSGGEGLPLWRVPFLKKYCRTPGEIDRAEWLEVFGEGVDMPNHITYHDPISMMGKVYAPVTNNDPDYRAKRMQSCMYLTAHNRANYNIVHEALERVFRRNPATRERLGKYTPSYSKVMISWYTDKRMPIDVAEKEEDNSDSLLEQGVEAMVFYGELSLMERGLNMMSLIPDLVTPSLRNLSLPNLLMRIGAEQLSWMTTLLWKANHCTTNAHLKACLENSPYYWVSDKVPHDSKDSVFTLLVRHWIYLSLKRRKPRSWFVFLNGIQIAISRLMFGFNAKVTNVTRSTYFPYLNMSLAVALNVIQLPSVPFESHIFMLRPFDIVGWADDLASAWLSSLLHKIPTSFNDVAAALQSSKQAIIQAATGVGKSTHLVHFVRMITQFSSPRLVVIVPRVNLAKGLANYMSTLYSESFGYGTGEGSLNLDAEVVYMTSGYFLKSVGAHLSKGYQFILDEAHIEEVDHMITRKLLRKSEEKVLYVTATPGPGLIADINGPLLSLPVSNTYSYEAKTIKAQAGRDLTFSYISSIKQITREHNRWARILVFVDSFDEMDNMTRNLEGECSTVSSKGTNITSSAKYIIATSAADVGVTLPNVDVCITKSIKRTLTTEGIDYIRVDPLLEKQRWGRVGRTSHGWAYTVEFTDVTVKEEPLAVFFPTMMMNIWGKGISPALITSIYKLPHIADMWEDGPEFVEMLFRVGQYAMEMQMEGPEEKNIVWPFNITWITYQGYLEEGDIGARDRITVPTHLRSKVGKLKTLEDLLNAYVRNVFGYPLPDDPIEPAHRSMAAGDLPVVTFVQWWLYFGRKKFWPESQGPAVDTDHDDKDYFDMEAMKERFYGGYVPLDQTL